MIRIFLDMVDQMKVTLNFDGAKRILDQKFAIIDVHIVLTKNIWQLGLVLHYAIIAKYVLSVLVFHDRCFVHSAPFSQVCHFVLFYTNI